MSAEQWDDGKERRERFVLVVLRPHASAALSRAHLIGFYLPLWLPSAMFSASSYLFSSAQNARLLFEKVSGQRNRVLKLA